PTSFFFQAEDGIRDRNVTGVQTCALPILTTLIDLVVVFLFTHPMMRVLLRTKFFGGGHRLSGLDPVHLGSTVSAYRGAGRVVSKIGRASCREAAGIAVGAASARRTTATRW